MCKVYSDNSPHGDFFKTRIEYCAHALEFPLSQRGDLPCQVLGEDPDLGGSSGCSSPQEQAALQQEHAHVKRQLDESRQDIYNLEISLLKTIRDTISSLGGQLLHCEDLYRELGGRYYGRGWYAHRNRRVSRRIYCSLADALHGKTPLHERYFFHRWIDLKSTISNALKTLTDQNETVLDRIRRTNRECKSAITLVLGIYRSLKRLRLHIAQLERLDELDDMSGRGPHLNSFQRDRALWDWLKSLPETDMALRAGKRKRQIMDDALYLAEEQVENDNSRLVLFPRWAVRNEYGHDEHRHERNGLTDCDRIESSTDIGDHWRMEWLSNLMDDYSLD